MICYIKFKIISKQEKSKHGNASLQYRVKYPKDPDITVPHLDKYLLPTQKYADFIFFKKGILLLKSNI
jgi:hypothetical protein